MLTNLQVCITETLITQHYYFPMQQSQTQRTKKVDDKWLHPRIL